MLQRSMEVLGLSYSYFCIMKKVLFILVTFLISCVEKNNSSTWIIHRVDGNIDTIEAKNYWIMTSDTLFIKFEIEKDIYIIYNKDNIIKYDYNN